MKIVQESAGSASVTLYDFEPTPDRICEDVVGGLSAGQKALPPKYFYDEVGAHLFERITGLEAYYPTRTEVSILKEHAADIATRIGPHVRLVEFGSGSGDKTWILLGHLVTPAAYIPVDISKTQLVSFALKVAEAFPALHVAPVCADYTAEFKLPPAGTDALRAVAFFPGSTIGNFEPDEAVDFLGRVRRLVGEGGGLVVGVDLRKERSIIETAYNDPDGVTAEFNVNLLARINRECDADFDLSAFQHHAIFDEEASRIEMRLVSLGDQTVSLGRGRESEGVAQIRFEAGEHIVTEYSHKYDIRAFEALAGRAGWSFVEHWTDERAWFAVVLLEAG